LIARSCWRSAGLAALILGLPGRLPAQRGADVQAQALGLAGTTPFAGVGAGAGLRLGLGTRLSLSATGGWLEAAGAAARVEALATYHLVVPGRPRPTLYGGTGVGITATGGATQGYLVLVLGLEGGVQARGGWFIETGVGGGIRVALGYRLIRWRNPRRR
jgi:hypothetical protein